MLLDYWILVCIQSSKRFAFRGVVNTNGHFKSERNVVVVALFTCKFILCVELSSRHTKQLPRIQEFVLFVRWRVYTGTFALKSILCKSATERWGCKSSCTWLLALFHYLWWLNLCAKNHEVQSKSLATLKRCTWGLTEILFWGKQPREPRLASRAGFEPRVCWCDESL